MHKTSGNRSDESSVASELAGQPSENEEIIRLKIVKRITKYEATNGGAMNTIDFQVDKSPRELANNDTIDEAQEIE
jgi:hypothetical protein